MKKVVIFVIIALIIAGGIWYWFFHPAAPESAGDQATRICSDDIKDFVLLLKAVQGDERLCTKLTGDLNAYCLAYFGKDVCLSRPEESQKSCLAVLNKNSGNCDDELCHGVLGNVEGCSTPSYAALARRDSAGLNVAEICKPIVASIVRDEECFKNARTPEEMDVCKNQSTLQTV